MKVDTYKCDVCGQMKGENNHWLRIESTDAGLKLYGWGEIASGPATVDLCSDQCVTKTVQQWLSAHAEHKTFDVAPREPRELRRSVVSIGGQRAS